MYDAGIPCWALVPASGIGSRMGADRPKQYLELEGKTILEHTLDRLAAHSRVDGLLLVLGEGDSYWPALGYRCDKPLLTTIGGSERHLSVRNGLRYLQRELEGDAAVLIHDAVRPLFAQRDIDRLLDAMQSNPAGAILATPVTDTLKQARADQSIATTRSREGLWRALTPQGFMLSAILAALEQVIANDLLVTDDASAMEACGYHPLLVDADPRNVKITHGDDLNIARLLLKTI